MFEFYKNLSAQEKRTLSTLARFSVLMFAIPLAIAMIMPRIITFCGITSPLSIFITAGSATLSVLGVAIVFAFIAYKENDVSVESRAKYIIGKQIKGE